MSRPTLDEAPTGGRALATNTAWLAAERVIGLVAAAGLSIALGRTLGPARFGDYSAAFNAAVIVADVASLGFVLVLGHEILDRPHDRGVILGTALRIRLVIGIASLVPTYAVTSWLLDDADAGMAAVVLAALPLVRSLESYEHVQQAYERGRSLALARAVSSLVVPIGVAAIVITGSEALWGPATIDVGRFALYGLVLLPIVHRRIPSRSVSRAEAARLLRKVAPLTLPTIAFAVNLRVDQVMLSALSRSHQVGIYAASARISEVAYFLPVVITTALFPRLVAARRASAERYRRTLVLSYSIMWVLGLTLAVAVAATAPVTLTAAYGQAFSGGTGVLQVLALGIPFVFLRGVFSRWIVLEDAPWLALWTSGVSAVLNVALNLVLIPRHGAMGAAAATVVSYAASGYALLWFLAPTRPLVRHMHQGLLHAPRTVVDVVRRGARSARR